MIVNGLNEFKGKRVLMLQGPVGPFFSRFATDLAQAGAVVFKVNFNGGDWLFSGSESFSDVFSFTGTLEVWPSYLEGLLQRLNIDTVFLFGDCRPIHAAAKPVIKKLGIRLGVFEEGYLRPDYITLERDGVNNNSDLPDNPKFYLDQPKRLFPKAKSLGNTYPWAAVWGILYFAAASLGWFGFRHYQHHRRLGFGAGPSWFLSYWRKFHYLWSERKVLSNLTGKKSHKFFLVSLQTRGDAQMWAHSNFETVDQFIEQVVASFAEHAGPDSLLVLKHHPLDRGFSDYSKLISRLKRQHQLGDRCHYIHDQHLPTLLRHTCGVVAVNSTVGLSAVEAGVPVKVCGASIYDIQGLTFQGSLDDFWRHAHLALPNHDLYLAFRAYLIAHTQHQGSFYKRLPENFYTTGVVWADHGIPALHPRSRESRQGADRTKHDLREQLRA